MANLYYLPAGAKAPDLIDVVIEVPMGSSNKYEYDPELNVFRLDRVLYSPMHYPGDYGFVPGTLADDGDPVDVLVLMNAPTFPGAVLTVRPLGYLEMSDEKGEDQKLLAVPAHDPRYDGNRHIDTISRHRLREIEHFFNIYKELEGKQTRVDGWRGLDEAHELIRRCIDAFRERLAAEAI
jgi:inorganic pyrophosphatase